MKRTAPLTLITALLLTGCSGESDAGTGPVETAQEATPQENSQPAEEPTPPDLDNLTQEEQAVLNARPDADLYARYSDQSVIEDAHHTCEHIKINLEHGNSIAMHTLDQIHDANSRAQTRRMEDPSYPDDTPYMGDMDYPVEQALVHLCPEVLQEVDPDMYDSYNEFTNAAEEVGYIETP